MCGIENNEELLEAKDRMETIESIKRGPDSMKRNDGKPADKFFQEFFAETVFPKTNNLVISEDSTRLAQDALCYTFDYGAARTNRENQETASGSSR